MDQRGDHMKINFDYFQMQKWMLQIVRAEEEDEKNRVICLVSMLPSRPFRYIHINRFNRPRFLAEVSTKLQKMHLFWTI